MKHVIPFLRAAAVGVVIAWSAEGFWSFQDQFEMAANLTALAVMAIGFQWVMKAAK